MTATIKRIGGIAAIAIIMVVFTACGRDSFTMAGMWKSDNGTILSFHSNGTVGATFFGFDGGPDGSWSISSKPDADGCYTLQGQHITGGSLIYKVRPLGKNEAELYAEGDVGFGSSYYHLLRQ